MSPKAILIVSVGHLFLVTSLWGQGNIRPAKPRPRPKAERTTKRLPARTGKSWKIDELDWVTLTDANGKKRQVGLSKAADGKSRVEAYFGGDGRMRIRDAKEQYRWKQFDRDGRPIWDSKRNVLDYFGDFELVGGRDVKMFDHVGNQIRLLKLDGTWELILGASDIFPGAGVKTKPDLIEMTVRYLGSDKYEVIDHREMHKYSTDASMEWDRLILDKEKSSLTYQNRTGRKVTVLIADDPESVFFELASRTILSDSAASNPEYAKAGMQTDSAGRLRRRYGRNGTIVSRYGYRIEEGEATLDQFRNSEGLWNLNRRYQSNEKGKKQQWALEGAKRVYMFADSIGVNRDRELVIQSGDKQLVHKHDGSTVQTDTKVLEDGNIEKTVSVGDYEKDTFKRLLSVVEIRDPDGKLISKEFWRSVTRYSSQDAITWTEHDQEGKPISGSQWFGDFQIADSPTTIRDVSVSAGTLVRTYYQTKLRADGSEDDDAETKSEELVIDADGRPVFKELIAQDTKGWGVRTFSSGGKIVYLPNKSICELEDIFGLRTRFHYEKDSAGKMSLQAIAQYEPATGAPLSQWVWKEALQKNGKTAGNFVNEYGDTIFMGVKNRSADGSVTRVGENEYGQELTITQLLDGRTRIQSYDGAIIERDGLGRVVYYRHAAGLGIRVHYEPESDRIDRIDWLHGGVTVFLSKRLPAEDRQDLPKDAKVIEVVDLELEDAAFPVRSDAKLSPVVISYVTLRDGLQVRKRQWLDGPITEHGIYNKVEQLVHSKGSDGNALTIQRDDQGRVARVDGHGFVLVTEGSSVPEGARIAKTNTKDGAPAKSPAIAVSDNRRGENSVTYFDGDGAKIRLYPDGSELHYVDRDLRYARNARGQEIKLIYDENGGMERVEHPLITLRRDSVIDWTRITNDAAGKPQETRLLRFEWLHWNERPILKLIHREGPTAVEYIGLIDDRREVRTRSGEILTYDDQDRLIREQDRQFDVFEYFYWENGTCTRAKRSSDQVKQDLDKSGRITYERTDDGLERFVAYGQGESRRETSADKSIRDFDEQGRIRYERDVNGAITEHYYLENGHHVVRQHVFKEGETEKDVAKNSTSTTWEPDPNDPNRERLIHHRLPSGLVFITHNAASNSDNFNRIAVYIVGDEKQQGRPSNSLVEFDPFGRMTYKRDAAGEEATFFYSAKVSRPLTAHDLTPHTIIDANGKWLRAGDSRDRDGNYIWDVTKNGRRTRKSGIFKLPLYQNARPFRSTADVTYSFVKQTPVPTALLAAGKDKDDYGNGIRVFRQADNSEIVEFVNAVGKSQQFVAAVTGTKIPNGVQSVHRFRLLENGGAEVVYLDGKKDLRSRHGVILRYGADEKLFGVVAPDGSQYANVPLPDHELVKAITLKEDQPVLHFANGHLESFTEKGDRLSFQETANGTRKLLGTTSADSKTKLEFKYGDDDRLIEIVRTAIDIVGVTHQKKFALNSEDYWTDGEDRYDLLRVDPNSGKVALFDDQRRLEISADGTELEINFPDVLASDAVRPVQIERDAAGQVKRIVDSRSRVTSFIRNQQNIIVVVLHENEAIVKHADGTWRSSQHDDMVLHATLTVHSDGSQDWKSDDGTTLKVGADNSLFLSRPDGSGYRTTADRLMTEYDNGPASPVSSVKVFEDGPTIFKLNRGQTYKYNPCTLPGKIRFEDSKQKVVEWLTGAISVSPSGTTTISLGAPPRHKTATRVRAHMFRRGGDIQRFTRSDSPAGIVWKLDNSVSLSSLHHIGASDPASTLIHIDGAKYAIPVSWMNPGLEELCTRSASGIARRYGVSADRLNQLAEAGTIPAIKDGDSYRFDVSKTDAAFFDQSLLQAMAVEMRGKAEKTDRPKWRRLGAIK